ncbi:ankyrin repeat protein [Metarhizium robertsii]|uniref:Natch and ankyrin domain protein n=2 Tax=Metarhizium robertsii TaxID=568076 RepID=E9F1R6_METRA|nr:natch and ankyrin domain protein [Metarhizium robertsii ARSEF 23]EFY98005.1 natch and ankyrin domain protein [Metarhizium robertsii ARSEF 23]EXU95238.1 ankyrin repeat protein [Metarhizium robertsii]
MASRDDYSVGWVCALPIEVAAAKATLDRIHGNLPPGPDSDDNNNYILGSLQGHNVVLAYPNFGVYGKTSVASVATQLHANFKSIRFNLMVGIAGGVPDTKGDIRLGDIVVSKSTAGWPGVVQYDLNAERAEDQFIRGRALDQPTRLLLTATGKAETAAIFDESQIPQYISEIVRKDPITFAHPGPEHDVLFEANYDHTTIESEENGCNHCNPDRIQPRRPRETQDPIVHYGLIASGHHLMRHGAARDKLAHRKGVLCLETEAAGLKDAAQYLVIRGICDYADSHSSRLWHAYAAVAAAAYAKEVLSFIPRVPKTTPLATNTYAEAAPVLDALLLTRPEVDRKSLIALKGRRVDGTCEWLIQHPSYREWLADASPPLLWISGGPGKGKTMLAIYITAVLQPVVDAAENVLLYYFCSNRDKNRNTGLTIMRGIIHQWIGLHPHMAQYIKNSFEGTETTKYTVSSFVSLWRVFLTLLRQSGSSQVVCVLDGLDECEKESLSQLLDAVGNYLSNSPEKSRPRLKLILLSRPQPAILESKLGQYQQIKLDDSDTEISHDVKRYIFAKVAELASEQNLSEEMVAQVHRALLAGADGTFLWVGFVANELQGKSWGEINKILRRVPKGLGGVYQRLLQQIDDKDGLVPILQWIVLAARPLTVDELTVATGIKTSGTFPETEVIKNRLSFCGLLVKIEGGVVNLVHESAKEFFQSDQVNIKGISMFRMSRHTHRTLMRTCLEHVERGYRTPERIDEKSGRDFLLPYASQYWPVHFHHAIDVIDAPSEFSRPFFQVDSRIRDEWWKFYWEQEKNGGNPPSFTLLHLAAYLGNVAWAKMLISGHARLISQKDNYGRAPLSWAVNRGHRDMVELLIHRGARVNAKDRSKLTALHIAVTGQHKDIVCVLLDQGARLESKTEHGDTALIRAIQANSKEIIQILLKRGARVNELPTPPGVVSLRGPTDPLEERVKELLGLQEQIFLARYKQASRKVDMVMKTLSLSFRFPIILQLMTLYLKFVAFDRWEHMSVLQELVKENRTDELRQWAEAYREFFVQLVVARNRRRLTAMTDLPTQVFRAVAPGDLQALLVIAVLVGSETKLAAVRHGWREGDTITARAFSHWTAIAYNRDAEEFLHYGVREFLNDFDACIRSGNREENVARTVVLLTSHFAMLENKEPRPIEYFSRVIAEFYEGYIGGSHEVELFSDANQACANELIVISKNHDSPRLLLFLTSILQFAQRSQDKGRDRFLNIPSASCLILCQENAIAHRWLIGEAIPEAMSALISKQPPGLLRKLTCKALVECLIIGKQYGLALPAVALTQRVKQHLHSLPGVENMINWIVGL